MNEKSSLSFRVITYNLALPVLHTTVQMGQTTRYSQIPEALRKLYEQYQYDVDAWIITELIPPVYVNYILEVFENMGFKYHTRALNGLVLVPGGVFIISKWPILQESQLKFEELCQGSCCWANKGVVYAKIEKPFTSNKKHIQNDENEHPLLMPIHLFGTHLQAEKNLEAKELRKKQLEKIQSFANSLHIPSDESVLMGGDWNIDIYHEADWLMWHERLSLFKPTLNESSGTRYSLDHQTNEIYGMADEAWTGSDLCRSMFSDRKGCICCPDEWVDVTLAHESYLKPLESIHEIVPIKVSPYPMKIAYGIIWNDVTDSSDHYPCVSSFELNTEFAIKNNEYHNNQKQMNQYSRNQHLYNTYSNWDLLFTLIIFICGLLLFVLLSYWFIHVQHNKKYTKHRNDHINTNAHTNAHDHTNVHVAEVQQAH